MPTDHISQSSNDNDDFPHTTSIPIVLKDKNTDDTSSTTSIKSTKSTEETTLTNLIDIDVIDTTRPVTESTTFSNDFESTTDTTMSSSSSIKIETNVSQNENESENSTLSKSYNASDTSTIDKSPIEISTVPLTTFDDVKTTEGSIIKDSFSTTETSTLADSSLDLVTTHAYTLLDETDSSTTHSQILLKHPIESSNTVSESNHITTDLQSNVVTTQVTTPYTNIEDYHSSIDSDVLLQSSSTIHVESTMKPYTKKTLDSNNSSTVSVENKNTKTPENQRKLSSNYTGITLIQDLPHTNITTSTSDSSTEAPTISSINDQGKNDFTKTPSAVDSELAFTKIITDDSSTTDNTHLISERTDVTDMNSFIKTKSLTATSDITTIHNNIYQYSDKAEITTQPFESTFTEITTETNKYLSTDTESAYTATTGKSEFIYTPQYKTFTSQSQEITSLSDELNTIKEENNMLSRTTDEDWHTQSTTLLNNDKEVIPTLSSNLASETFATVIPLKETLPVHVQTHEISYNTDTTSLKILETSDILTATVPTTSDQRSTTEYMGSTETKYPNYIITQNFEDIKASDDITESTTETTLYTNKFNVLETSTTSIDASTLRNNFKQDKPYDYTVKSTTEEITYVGDTKTTFIDMDRTKDDVTTEATTTFKLLTLNVSEYVTDRSVETATKPKSTTEESILSQVTDSELITTQTVSRVEGLIPSQATNNESITTETVKYVHESVLSVTTDMTSITPEVLRDFKNTRPSESTDIESVTTEKIENGKDAFTYQPTYDETDTTGTVKNLEDTYPSQSTVIESVTTETVINLDDTNLSEPKDVESSTNEKVNNFKGTKPPQSTNFLSVTTETIRNVVNAYPSQSTYVESVTTETVNKVEDAYPSQSTDVVSDTTETVRNVEDTNPSQSTDADLVTTGMVRNVEDTYPTQSTDIESVTTKTIQTVEATTPTQPNDIEPVTTETVKNIEDKYSSQSADVESVATETIQNVEDTYDSQSNEFVSVSTEVVKYVENTTPSQPTDIVSVTTNTVNNNADRYTLQPAQVESFTTEVVKNVENTTPSQPTDVELFTTEPITIQPTDTQIKTETVKDVKNFIPSQTTNIVSVTTEAEPVTTATFKSTEESNSLQTINVGSISTESVRNIYGVISTQATGFESITTESVKNTEEKYSLPDEGSITAVTVESWTPLQETANVAIGSTETVKKVDELIPTEVTPFSSSATVSVTNIIESQDRTTYLNKKEITSTTNNIEIYSAESTTIVNDVAVETEHELVTTIGNFNKEQTVATKGTKTKSNTEITYPSSSDGSVTTILELSTYNLVETPSTNFVNEVTNANSLITPQSLASGTDVTSRNSVTQTESSGASNAQQLVTNSMTESARTEIPSSQHTISTNRPTISDRATLSSIDSIPKRIENQTNYEFLFTLQNTTLTSTSFTSVDSETTTFTSVNSETTISDTNAYTNALNNVFDLTTKSSTDTELLKKYTDSFSTEKITDFTYITSDTTESRHTISELQPDEDQFTNDLHNFEESTHKSVTNSVTQGDINKIESTATEISTKTTSTLTNLNEKDSFPTEKYFENSTYQINASKSSESSTETTDVSTDIESTISKMTVKQTKSTPPYSYEDAITSSNLIPTVSSNMFSDLDKKQDEGFPDTTIVDTFVTNDDINTEKIMHVTPTESSSTESTDFIISTGSEGLDTKITTLTTAVYEVASTNIVTSSDIPTNKFGLEAENAFHTMVTHEYVETTPVNIVINNVNFESTSQNIDLLTTSSIESITNIPKLKPDYFEPTTNTLGTSFGTSSNMEEQNINKKPSSTDIFSPSTTEYGTSTSFEYTETTTKTQDKDSTVVSVPEQGITVTLKDETQVFNETLFITSVTSEIDDNVLSSTESSNTSVTPKTHTSTGISTSTESLSSRRKVVDISAWTDTTLITDMTSTETTVQSTDIHINTYCKLNTHCPTNKFCLNGVCQNPCEMVGSGCTKSESCIVVNHAAVCVCDDATGKHCLRKGRLTKRCFDFKGLKFVKRCSYLYYI